MPVIRRSGWLALIAMLAACGGAPESSSSAAPDASSDSGAATAAESPPLESPGPAADPDPTGALLTPDGWGPLRIGMSLAEVVAAAGPDANPAAVGGPVPSECDEFRPGDAPAGVLVMVERGVLTRISVSRNRDISTPAGIRVGDPASTVLAAYGSRARVEPHKYVDAPARYITVWREGSPEADRRGIRYEVGPDGDVVHLRAGGGSIEYVEGCL